jgi:hypothetical protein
VNVADIVWLFAKLGNDQSELVLFDVNHFPTGKGLEIVETGETEGEDDGEDDGTDEGEDDGEDRGKSEGKSKGDDKSRGSDLFAKADYLAELVAGFAEVANSGPRITWITNKASTKSGKRALCEYSWSAGSENVGKLKDGEPIQGAWPENVFALSHICIPIAKDDFFYGETSILHRLNPKGERSVLAISMDDVTRLKYNPFFDYATEKCEEMIDSH